MISVRFEDIGIRLRMAAETTRQVVRRPSALAGGIMLVGGILLFSRRFTPKMRILSIFQDYFVLSMLLVIVLLGIGMRLWAPIHAAEVQHYVRGVLTLRPAVEISNILFLWHIFFAQVLIMYLPFSKLIHLVSKPVAESWTMR